jgi:hypothetical protein
LAHLVALLEAGFQGIVWGGFIGFIHLQPEVLGTLAEGGVAGFGEELHKAKYC